MLRRRLLSNSKTYVSIALAAAMASLAGCWNSSGAGVRVDEHSALLVRVQYAVPVSDYTVMREFIGRVEATRQSQVGFELAGEVLEVMVDEGEPVTAGARLAQLDTTRLEARLAEARASLDQAMSAQQLAQRSFARNQEAAEFDGISAQELDLARDAANAARAGVAAAEARVNSVLVDIAKSRITAPYDAVVVARRVDEGEIVAAGQPVLLLQELAAPEVRVGVSGDLTDALEPGQIKHVTIANRAVDAAVRSVLPVRDPSTRTVDVILQLTDSAAAVPGDLARLEVEQTILEDGYWLPTDALAEGSRGLWITYVAMPLDSGSISSTGATHFLQPRSLELLYEEGERVLVRGALSPGDAYVTSGLQRIVPQQEVRVLAETLVRGDTEVDDS